LALGDKFTKEEDAAILKAVKKYGTKKSTWIALAEKMGRSYEIIRSRYFNTIKLADFIAGKWTTEENEICLNMLFKNKVSSPELINSISQKDLQPVADALSRHVLPVSCHWEAILKPTLLAHHRSAVFTNPRPPFFLYLIERKSIAFQDIDWEDVKRHFPSQTITYLEYELHSQLRSLDKVNPHEVRLPLFMKLKNNISLWKDQPMSEKAKRYRERIINLYDKIRRLPSR